MLGHHTTSCSSTEGGTGVYDNSDRLPPHVLERWPKTACCWYSCKPCLQRQLRSRDKQHGNCCTARYTTRHTQNFKTFKTSMYRSTYSGKETGWGSRLPQTYALVDLVVVSYRLAHVEFSFTFWALGLFCHTRDVHTSLVNASF